MPRGILVALSAVSAPSHDLPLARDIANDDATYGNLALGLRAILDHLAAHGTAIDTLHLAGGHTRNPLYLANISVACSAVAMFHTLYAVPVALASLLFLYTLVLKHEEGELENTFGDEYRR